MLRVILEASAAALPAETCARAAATGVGVRPEEPVEASFRFLLSTSDFLTKGSNVPLSDAIISTFTVLSAINSLSI
jgi:hypothetical protein